MTIGIGVVCEAGRCIVMAADTRGSFPTSLRLRPHDHIGKQFDLPYQFGCNVAGDSSLCTGIDSELHKQMEGLPQPFFHDHIRDAIKESQFYELTNIANYELKKKLGITVAEWKSQEVARWVREEGKRVIGKIQLPIQITVGGICRDSAVLLQADFANPPDIREWSVIGSGSLAATDVLCKRKYEAHVKLQRAVVHVREALLAAKKAAKKLNPTNPDIGEPSDYIVITPKYFRRLPAQHPDLTRIAREYRTGDLEDLDNDDDARDAILNALYFPGTTKNEYALGFRRHIFDNFVWRGKAIHCDAETLRILSETSFKVAANPQYLHGRALELDPN